MHTPPTGRPSWWSAKAGRHGSHLPTAGAGYGPHASTGCNDPCLRCAATIGRPTLIYCKSCSFQDLRGGGENGPVIAGELRGKCSATRGRPHRQGRADQGSAACNCRLPPSQGGCGGTHQQSAGKIADRVRHVNVGRSLSRAQRSLIRHLRPAPHHRRVIQRLVRRQVVRHAHEPAAFGILELG